jgi:uncharacterized membrane protein
MLNKAVFTSVGAGLILAAATFFITRHLVIRKAPETVMDTIENSVVQRAGGWNQCFHNRQYGPKPNAVRRANPDSIVSIMAYDLSERPVRISGETWPRYWSLSLYQQNSDNYFVINDKQLSNSNFDFILTLDADETPNSGETVGVNAQILRSPTEKGIMLIRRFAASDADMPNIRDNQNALYCGPA